MIYQIKYLIEEKEQLVKALKKEPQPWRWARQIAQEQKESRQLKKELARGVIEFDDEEE